MGNISISNNGELAQIAMSKKDFSFAAGSDTGI